jgi:di/tricarboxylate transporter
VSVLAVGRRGRSLPDRPLRRRLAGGDSLLLVGHEDVFERMRRDPRVLLPESRPLPPRGRSRAPLALALMAFVVVASAARLLEPALAILTAAVVAVLTRCVPLREAYRAIDWRIVMVLGGTIPFGLALETTGTAHLLADAVSRAGPGLGPWPAFALLLLLTVGLTQLIENAAAAAILAPIAYELARATGADPMPFLLGMAVCTSGGFCTPWAHESTLLVFGPGRYRMAHYLALGVPFTLITLGVTAVVVPLLHPLSG